MFIHMQFIVAFSKGHIESISAQQILKARRSSLQQIVSINMTMDKARLGSIAIVCGPGPWQSYLKYSFPICSDGDGAWKKNDHIWDGPVAFLQSVTIITNHNIAGPS